jgi:hypothetical protein
MNARQKLRLRVDAADHLVRASDAMDPFERARLLRAAEELVARADAGLRAINDPPEMDRLEEEWLTG